MINSFHNKNSLITTMEMADNFVDLTVTSPPYDALRKYNGYKFPFKHIARHLFRVTKTGGVLIWIVGDSVINGSESGTSFKQALFFIECGFRLHDTMIYKKENFIPLNHNRYEQEFEYMFCFSKGRPKTFNPIKIKSKTGGCVSQLNRKGYGFRDGSFRRRNQEQKTSEFKTLGNIFIYPTGASKKNHPAVFPYKLAADQIATWSNVGEVVYDPFGGSGTTAEASIDLDRYFIYSEISKEYFDDAKKRIEQKLMQQKLILE